MNDNIIIAAIVGVASVIGVIFAIIYAVKGGKRADAKDARQDTMQLSRIEYAVGAMAKTMDEIRVEMRVQRERLNDHEMRITRIETRCEMKGEKYAEPN